MSRTDDPARSTTEDLPYLIELWHVDGSAEVERVLARALSPELAQAIFKAAQSEHPGRRITVRKENRVIADTE
jgi:hypothetical protein